MKYKTIDLCAGIGGIRKGFELTGRFENVLAAEIDPYAARTYKHLYGEDPTNDLTSEEFKRKVVNTEYDVLLAGFPCQSFSRVGKQLGFRDTTRGTIFSEIADIISRTNPKAVFLENVENLVFHDKGHTIETIVKTLEEELEYRIIGVTLDDDGNYVYSRSTLIRNTKDFGLPQNRPRTYIMAFSKKIYGKAVKLLNGQLPTHGNKVIFNDVTELLDTNVDDKYYMARGYLETLKKHKERQRKKGYGFGYSVVNRDNGDHPIAHTILATGGSGKERNLIYQPKPGVAGKMIEGRKTELNSEGIRVMTPDEWGRLQGFIGYAFIKNGRETFSFPEETTDGQKYKQLGNSVSIPVIECMSAFMIECFDLLQKQQVEVVRAMAENKPFFTKRDVMEMLDINQIQAGTLLKTFVNSGELRLISRGKGARYAKSDRNIELPPFSQEEKVLELAENRDFIRNSDVQEMLNCSHDNANVLLSVMAKNKKLERISRGKYKAVVDTRD